MKIIVGLGNPESKYFLTRHNIGFLAIDYLAEELNASKIKSNKNSHLLQADQDEKILLVKPQTYMNLSGKAVLELMSFYKLKLEDFLIITDEVDLTFGTTKILKGRGHGGHNGLRSIIDSVGKDFARLRVGISPPPTDEPRPNIPLDRFVLGNFTKTEQQELPHYLKFINTISLSFIRNGIQDTMTRYNKRYYKNL